MATNNSVNSPLSGTTGTGNFVGSTSPSLTTPKIGQINDVNGVAIIELAAASAPVNYFRIYNGNTLIAPQLRSIGSDTNINLDLVSKGTGQIRISSEATVSQFQINTGPSYQHLNALTFPNTAATTSYIFPDLSGTVALSGASQNVQFGQVGANGPNISTYALTAHGGTNQNLAISGATLIANAVTLAAVNDANSANIPLEIRASGIYASAGMVDSTAGNIVKWNPTGGQFTYDSQPLSVSLGGTGVTTKTGTGSVVLNTAPTLSQITFSTTSGIVGTTTNDSAAAGSVGEYVSSSVSSGSPVSLTSGVASNLTSISLTAGDWDVYYNAIYFPANTTTLTRVYSGLNSTSATQPGINDASTTIQTVGITGDGANIFYNTNGSIRVSLNATTTYYAVVQGTFAVSTCTAFGWLWARRRR